ncbi:hypothetical protein [Algihabitans albus]|uniref:hypothetical protein n=1 Tax=Algihabitans albus TaxID=2164067 RepID=UPI000E5C7A0D|nr:hypothetical protein [Algihabitans albus]
MTTRAKRPVAGKAKNKSTPGNETAGAPGKPKRAAAKARSRAAKAPAAKAPVASNLEAPDSVLHSLAARRWLGQ